jgi:hypothetical protein
VPELWYVPVAAAGGGGGGALTTDRFITWAPEVDLTAEITTAVMNGYGPVASLPTAGHAGFLYYASDTNQLYRDNGSTWDTLTPLSTITASNAVTFTNKRITRRIETLTDAATVTPASDTNDGGYLASLSQPTTLANPTGTPTNFQPYILRVKSAAVQAWTFGNQYRGSTQALPTATSGGGKTDYFGLQYNAQDTKWDLLDYNPGF